MIILPIWRIGNVKVARGVEIQLQIKTHASVVRTIVVGGVQGPADRVFLFCPAKSSFSFDDDGCSWALKDSTRNL